MTAVESTPIASSELAGLLFACLDDCGFCCTFTPQVTEGELARLRRGLPTIPIARERGVMHIAFQGGCGACSLLKARKCTAYEDRPAHCRYFPFHVYFGRRTEVYVNRTCRGVEPAVGGDLGPAFSQQVLAVARPHELAEHARLARKVHADFERNARAAGAWADVDQAIASALQAPDLFSGAPSPERWQAALEPFAEDDVVARPFYLDPKLRWLTFERRGQRLHVLEMQEDGTLEDEGARIRLAAAGAPEGARPGLRACIERLATRDLFAGTVFHRVDDSDYRLGIERAARERVMEVAADLLVRVQILEALGVPGPDLAGEAERFYDSAFLDAPTIGGWL
jgi:Fe-S-cluster containining protein